MHVLIIPSWYPRQPGDINGCFFREQAIALRKHGCKVGVIYPELRSLRNWRSFFLGQNVSSVEQDEGVLTYRFLGMNWFPRTVVAASKLFVWRGLQLFKRYIEENGRPDIMHVHSLLYAGSVAAAISKKYAIPFVVTEHSTAFARGIISAKGMLLAQSAAAVASKKYAVSGEFAHLLNRLVVSTDAAWEEMPNIVNGQFCAYPLPSKNHGFYFRFINVALMDEKKRQANILHAFAQTYKSYPNVLLTLGGDGPERNELEQLASNLGIAEKVNFTGLLSREQVLAEMASADAFVLSSLYETFGVVVIEALALGKPVIATRCGGPESIVRKEDGILIEVEDVNALAAAMRQMIEDRNDYDPEVIRQSCIARYSEAAIAARLKQVYAEVISKRSRLQQNNLTAAASSVNA